MRQRESSLTQSCTELQASITFRNFLQEENEYLCDRSEWKLERGLDLKKKQSKTKQKPKLRVYI